MDRRTSKTPRRRSYHKLSFPVSCSGYAASCSVLSPSFLPVSSVLSASVLSHWVTVCKTYTDRERNHATLVTINHSLKGFCTRRNNEKSAPMNHRCWLFNYFYGCKFPFHPPFLCCFFFFHFMPLFCCETVNSCKLSRTSARALLVSCYTTYCVQVHQPLKRILRDFLPPKVSVVWYRSRLVLKCYVVWLPRYAVIFRYQHWKAQ